ncbi:MAG: HEAT repeat domain-containing protein [Kiritimatiellae bacterium]|nr:HEAT repeat domain-containing protein [Kiritimatiellia bacterium]
MKKTLFAAAVFCATAAAAAGKAVVIAYPAAGYTDLVYPEHRIRIAMSNFLTDCLKSEPTFRPVSEERSGAIFTRIESGAMEYGTENLAEIYSRYFPVDVAVRYRPVDFVNDWSCRDYEFEAWNRERGVKRRLKAAGGDVAPLAVDLVEMVADVSGVDAATKERMLKVARERQKVFTAVYIAPRVVGHYTDNTGETRMGWVTPVLKATKGDPRVFAKVADASLGTITDWRLVKRTSRIKLLAMGLEAVFKVIGHPEIEEELKGFLNAVAGPRGVSGQMYSDEEAQLLKLAEPLSRDTESRLLDDALSTDTEDEMSETLADAQPKKSVAQKEAVGRGALRALAWMKSKKVLPLLEAAAKRGDPETRRVVAECLRGYTNETAKAALARLAGDPDSETAVATRLPAAVGAARKLAKKASLDALWVLATYGGQSDRAQFDAHVDSPDPKIRRECVRGIFARTKWTAGDLPLISDPNEFVTVAGLHEIKSAQVKADSDLYALFCRLANDPCAKVSDAAMTLLSEIAPQGGKELAEYRLAVENPYFRRRVLRESAAAGGADGRAMLLKGCGNSDPQVRAYALRLLGEKDPAAALPALVEALKDAHTWVRLHAAAALADAKPAKGDAKAIAAALAKERNRVVKLYLSDALAVAEGRPKPPPLKPVNSDNGRAVNWMCGYNTPHADTDIFDGYYTCGLPAAPTEAMKVAHDVRGAKVFPRPTPIGDPGHILVNGAMADSFWTELEKQLPPGVIEYCDGFVYGEESMNISPAGIWGETWRMFCVDAGIDPDRVRGDFNALTENEKLAYNDWGLKVGVEGFNEMYDFTKLYFGKLRPGIRVCTYITDKTGNSPYDHLWKFDVGGVYQYDYDSRTCYSTCRQIKSTWPDRPLQWLSFGNINIGLGGSCYGRPGTYLENFPTHPISRRFEHCYADSFAVWLAGADTGYFANYAVDIPDAIRGSPGCQFSPLSVYPDSPQFKKAVEHAFSTAQQRFRDDAKRASRKNDDAAFVDSEDEITDLSLEEEGSKNDPIMKKIAAKRKEMWDGYHFMTRAMRDTAAVEVGLERRFPGHLPAALIRADAYGPAGMLAGMHDRYASMLPVVYHGTDLVATFDYVVLGDGGKMRMDEKSRSAWVDWLKKKPGVLIVTGWTDPGVAKPYCRASCVNGDLKTPWPWNGAIKYVPAGSNASVKYPAHYEPGEGCEVLVKDEKGRAVRVVWRGGGVKALVIFDLTTGAEAVASLKKTVAEHCEKAKLRFRPAEHPGEMRAEMNGLDVCVLANTATDTIQMKGFDLLTGAWNPVVNRIWKCAATAEEYYTKFVAVHAGVCVVAHDAEMKLLEKLPDGVKVEVKGLVRVTTKGGGIARITGADLPEVKTDPNQWFLYGKGPGVCTLPPHGGVQCVKRLEKEVDEMPPWRIFRFEKPTVVTITE